jgi:transposase
VDGLKGRARAALGVQDGTMRLSRAQFEALFEGLAPLSANACIRLAGNGRRVMAQRVAPPTAVGWFILLF